MRVLITGATGYAGRSAALAFRRAGYKVAGLVRNDKHPVLATLRQNEIVPLFGNLLEPETYRPYIAKADIVVHTVFDFANPAATDDKFLDVFQEEANKSSDRKRLVYTTGCSIYGKVDVEIMDERTPCNPQHALFFRVGHERRVLSMSNTLSAVLRPGFMYGLDAKASQSGRFFSTGANATGDRITFWGNPKKRWSWVHVDDLGEAYVRAAQRLNAVSGEIFCVADEHRPATLEVFTRCARQAGFKGEVEVKPASESRDAFVALSDQDELITSSKARNLLNWVPRHTGLLDDLPRYYEAWSVAREPHKSQFAASLPKAS